MIDRVINIIWLGGNPFVVRLKLIYPNTFETTKVPLLVYVSTYENVCISYLVPVICFKLLSYKIRHFPLKDHSIHSE